MGLRVRRQSSMIDGDGTDLTAVTMEPVDELAFLDIDVLRDELQSAKQMLSAEVESKHHLERKTRDQKCHIIAMEAEIESLKAKLGLIPEDEVSILAKDLEKSDSKTLKLLYKSGSSLWKSPSGAGIRKSKSGLAKQSPSDANVHGKADGEEELAEVNEMEEEIISLKEAVQHARKQAEDMESKYKEAATKLKIIQENLNESEQQRKGVEKQLETLLAQEEGNRILPQNIQTAERTTQTEEQIFELTSGTYSRQQSMMEEVSDSDEDDNSDIEVDEEGVMKKKQERELKLWDNKVRSIKDKQHTSRLERRNLKTLQKKLETELKDAKKRHKMLQKEVNKMAKMLKDAEKDEDEEEEENEEDEDEEVKEEDDADQETEEDESEEEEETESDSDEEGDNSSEEDDENASYEDRLAVFGKRARKRENVLHALRKGNYLLRANIDRLKDDLEEERIAYHDLEHELNSVLDEM